MFNMLLQHRQKLRNLILRRSILNTQLLLLRKISEMLLIQQTQQNVMQSLSCFLVDWNIILLDEQ